MVLSKEHPRDLRYRSAEPVLTPALPQERHGTVPNIVFPTGIDRRNDIGLPNRLDVYYGMADDRIGVARLDVPERFPQGALANGRIQTPERAIAVGLNEHLTHTTGSRDFGEHNLDRSERRAVIPAAGQETGVQT
jgi:hypothetical protein